MASIRSLPAAADPTQVNHILEHEGCVIVRDLLGIEITDAIQRELDPYLTAETERRSASTQGFLPGNTRRVVGLIAKSQSYCALVTHPLMLAVCDEQLKPNCTTYQVHTTAALVVGRGAQAQVLHREEDPFAHLAQPHPNLVVASMWAINDFTRANGATRLVPGSHRWPAARAALDEQIADAEMSRGSLLLWMGATLHGAGASQATDWRFGVFLSFSLGWLRQEENQYLSVPPEIARTLAPDLQRLLGYQTHGPFLGYTSVGDPLRLLRSTDR